MRPVTLADAKREQEKFGNCAIRYRRLFETARDGILILDAVTRRIIDVNPFMMELLGYSREEFLEKELWEIGLLKDPEASRVVFRELQQEGYIRYEDLPLHTKDGKMREVEFVSNVYDEDDHQVIQCNIRDITVRKQAEDNVRKSHEELIALVAELQRRDTEMQLLNRMHNLLQSCATQEEAYEVIAVLAGELFSGQSGCLAVLSDSDRDLQTVARWGDEIPVERGFSLQDCWALQRGEVHEVIDSRGGLRCRHFVHQPMSGYRCVPLTVQGETLGVFCLVGDAGTRDKHQSSQLQLAVTVCEAIKLSLSNLKLREKLSEEAIHDPLTGLFNRRFLEETLSRDVFRAQRRDSPLCVVMLDLDDFKRFNDTFGHDVGDSLLRELGNVLRENLRKGDISCRYGGDEFVVVLLDSALADTQKRVEQICVLLKEMQIRHGRPLLDTVTASAGIAQAGVHGSNPSELLRAADKALYAAKEAGRDRVVIYQSKKP
ncbi:MAG TPA: diguanylate cyclase [Methylomirabilota bacterium]|nr:diguanylate cyclase [Methylomirabilota bacterium]